MIKVTFANSRITFACSKTGKESNIEKRDFHEIFEHPRHMISDPVAATQVFQKEIKKYSKWMAPKVTVQIEQEVLGGLTPVDKRAIKESLMRAGARDVILI